MISTGYSVILFPLLQIDTIGWVVVKLHQFDTIVCKAASPPVVIPTTNIMENQLLKSIGQKNKRTKVQQHSSKV